MKSFFKQLVAPTITRLGRRKEQRMFTEPPILIGGCARSGTTLLLSILSSHREIYAFSEELSLFNAGRMDRLYREILFNRIPRTSNRWLEKTPRNVLMLDEIDRHFNGRFRFIHLIRDGRDVVLSKHPTQPDQYWVSPDRWINDVTAGLAYEDHPRVITAKYEDLVLNNGEEVARIARFLELKSQQDLNNWYKRARVRKNKAFDNGLEELYMSSIGKWKRMESAPPVKELLSRPEAINLLERLGYMESAQG